MVMQHKYPRPSTQGYCCPRCGRPVTESDLWGSENEYPFQCVNCDEDFYAIECVAEHGVLKDRMDQFIISAISKNQIDARCG